MKFSSNAWLAVLAIIAAIGGIGQMRDASLINKQNHTISELLAELERTRTEANAATNAAASASANSLILKSRLEGAATQNAALSRSLTAVRAESGKSQEELVTAAVKKALPSVVSIYAFSEPDKAQAVSAGSGFFVAENGYIVTNKHVVSDPELQYEVRLQGGAELAAKVIYRDAKYDLALLKIDGNGYPALPLGNSGGLAEGQTVIAIGNALGKLNNSTSVGIVSGLDRTILARDDDKVDRLSGLIQTSAALNPGNSGGPLLDLSGKVVGINVAMASNTANISFALPIDQIRAVLSRRS